MCVWVCECKNQMGKNELLSKFAAEAEAEMYCICLFKWQQNYLMYINWGKLCNSPPRPQTVGVHSLALALALALALTLYYISISHIDFFPSFYTHSIQICHVQCCEPFKVFCKLIPFRFFALFYVLFGYDRILFHSQTIRATHSMQDHRLSYASWIQHRSCKCVYLTIATILRIRYYVLCNNECAFVCVCIGSYMKF